MSAFVRRAKSSDAEAIHKAHMRSIQEVCSNEHSEEEILAWGHREYKEEQRLDAINNDLVWVAEDNGNIEGYGHFRIFEKDGLKRGHIFGLYLTPKVLGKSLGKAIMNMILEEAQNEGVQKITLESTITAYDFYKKMGFVESGPLKTVQISQTPIRCYPMVMEL